jgi:hypothetical protein
MLTEVMAQLEDATKEGKRERIGNAHLAVVSALGEMIEESTLPPDDGACGCGSERL